MFSSGEVVIIKSTIDTTVFIGYITQWYRAGKFAIRHKLHVIVLNVSKKICQNMNE